MFIFTQSYIAIHIKSYIVQRHLKRFACSQRWSRKRGPPFGRAEIALLIANLVMFRSSYSPANQQKIENSTQLAQKSVFETCGR